MEKISIFFCLKAFSHCFNLSRLCVWQWVRGYTHLWIYICNKIVACERAIKTTPNIVFYLKLFQLLLHIYFISVIINKYSFDLFCEKWIYLMLSYSVLITQIMLIILVKELKQVFRKWKPTCEILKRCRLRKRFAEFFPVFLVYIHEKRQKSAKITHKYPPNDPSFFGQKYIFKSIH